MWISPETLPSLLRSSDGRWTETGRQMFAGKQDQKRPPASIWKLQNLLKTQQDVNKLKPITMSCIQRIILAVVMMAFSGMSYAGDVVVLIAYHSETGNTEAMAHMVREGASRVDGVSVVLKTVEETTEEDLLDADAIIVGSPVYNANVTPAVSSFISSWPFEGEPLKGKLGAAFVTAGGVSAGEELVQMNILQSMLIFGMIVMGGPDWTSPFGASAIRGEEFFPGDQPIHPVFLEKGRALGERVATTVKRLQ